MTINSLAFKTYKVTQLLVFASHHGESSWEDQIPKEPARARISYPFDVKFSSVLTLAHVKLNQVKLKSIRGTQDDDKITVKNK